MREDALANHARDARQQNARGNEARASGRDRLRGGFGGVLVDDGIERLFFGMNSYDSNSTKDRLSIATARTSL